MRRQTIFPALSIVSKLHSQNFRDRLFTFRSEVLLPAGKRCTEVVLIFL